MIGIFDSGLGGLTVVKEIFRQLPGYDTVYFGDTARTPYGNKSPATLRRFALQDANFLISQGARVIVVACNTVSAVAIDHLRKNLDVPVIEVVTPAVESAVGPLPNPSPKGEGNLKRSLVPGEGNLKRGSVPKIGLIGTRATVNSGIYDRKIDKLVPGMRIQSLACPLFVPLVEEGCYHHPETAMVAKRYLSRIEWPKVDTLILGCTHYPFLAPVIRKAVGPKVRLVDPARETALSLKRLLEDSPSLDRILSKRDKHRFFVSDRTERFSALASAWLKRPVHLKQANLES